MKKELESLIKAAVKSLFGIESDIELTLPEEQFGDFATNVALQLAQKLDTNPRELAVALADKLREELKGQVSDVSVAGPGFINLKLTDQTLLEALKTEPEKSLDNKVVVAEYSDPNPFKILHAGHVYTTVVGDAIANLMEMAGATVHRVNYGGDVGLHVAKTMWAILKKLGGENSEKLQTIETKNRAAWLAACYVEGNSAYESDDTAKTEIVEFNKKIYKIQKDNDQESSLAQIYWTCRQWSYEAFDAFYKRLGTKLERYYSESEISELGLKLVKAQLGKVFEESAGAVVFKGEKFDLHTRVFINREGLPTYEAKEVGLIVKKYEDYNYDRSVIVTANEQEQYMIVVLKAIEQFLPELAQATTHIPHGMVRLSGNVKMSSRLGNIIPASEVIEATAKANYDLIGQENNDTTLGAIKYAFLKTRIGGNLIYDPVESVSLEGNSGPYLQYAYARACSVILKSNSHWSQPKELTGDERRLVRKISEFPEIVNKAVTELMPHHICTYLYELAQEFNRFYEHNRILGNERMAERLWIVNHYAKTLKKGLELLGIVAPEKL